MHGNGIYLWPTGERLEGKWKNNLFIEGNYFNSIG